MHAWLRHLCMMCKVAPSFWKCRHVFTWRKARSATNIPRFQHQNDWKAGCARVLWRLNAKLGTTHATHHTWCIYTFSHGKTSRQCYPRMNKTSRKRQKCRPCKVTLALGGRAWCYTCMCWCPRGTSSMQEHILSTQKHVDSYLVKKCSPTLPRMASFYTAFSWLVSFFFPALFLISTTCEHAWGMCAPWDGPPLVLISFWPSSSDSRGMSINHTFPMSQEDTRTTAAAWRCLLEYL